MRQPRCTSELVSAGLALASFYGPPAVKTEGGEFARQSHGRFRRTMATRLLLIVSRELRAQGGPVGGLYPRFATSRSSSSICPCSRSSLAN